MSVDVTLSGPVFDGRAEEWSHKALNDMQQSVADHALAMWESGLDASIRHPGPVYQLFPHTVKRDLDVLVNDGWGDTNDLQYGPWLEGVGSRNSPVTRFPGYHALRNAFNLVKGYVDDLCASVASEYVDRVNHE